MGHISSVNTKMGSQSVPRFSKGNTLPLTQLPFGMASFLPQTDGKTNWFFHPDHPYTEGIRLTHQPSPWIGDYGTFLFLPQRDVIGDSGEDAWSGYRPSEALLAPDYLKLHFLRSDCLFELVPTERGAAFRLTFGKGEKGTLSLLPVKGTYTYFFDADQSMLYATTDGHSQDIATDFKTYLVCKLPRGSVDTAHIRVGDGFIHLPLTTLFLEGQLAISYISFDMAKAALEREVLLPFEALRNQSAAIWEEHLGRIEIEARDEAQEKLFYSCLYRTFLFPHKAYELDKENNPIHYAPADGKIYPGVRYTDNGFWDTYRTVYPLFALIARDEYEEMLEGFVNDYVECGWLPRWPSTGEVGCMPSTLIDAVIADAAVKGIGKHRILEKALEGMLHHANRQSDDPRYGRNGAISYVKYGYVPRDEQKESVNLTQDAAYGDWCIAVVAKILGREELVEPYLKRSQNYKNLFDSATGFMRGRDKKGAMAPDFDPCRWGGEYTEGSAWQNSFAVPHDIEGLAALYGGKSKLIAKLDELFATPPRYRVTGYGREIHEMTEMAAVDFGQCAISNQPSFHLPWLFSALGAQEKTEYWVEKLINQSFSADEGGLPGDEDNGTMAAWVIFALLGFYPLCPGKNEYIQSKMLLKSAKIKE